MEINNNDEVIFNQAQYQQRRLDKLFERRDTLSINPTIYNPNYMDYNYKILFNDLISVFLTISAKCSDEEKEAIDKIRKELDTLLEKTPPHKLISDHKGRTGMSKLCFPAWSLFGKELRELRLELEIMMDVHGFGNPSKADKSKAISEM